MYPKVMRLLLLQVFMCYITTTLSCDDSYRQAFWIRDVLFDDVTITDYIISVSGVGTKSSCAIMCQDNRFCVTFSHNEDRSCRLHSIKFSNSTTFSHSPGWSYYYQDPGDCPAADGYLLIDWLNLCFKPFPYKRTFYEARDVCSLACARLIILDSSVKHVAITNYIHDNVGTNPYYIGLSDEAVEGVFEWVDGHGANVTQWNNNEPNDAGGGEVCAVMSPNTRTWYDIKCVSTYKFICERPWWTRH